MEEDFRVIWHQSHHFLLIFCNIFDKAVTVLPDIYSGHIQGYFQSKKTHVCTLPFLKAVTFSKVFVQLPSLIHNHLDSTSHFIWWQIMWDLSLGFSCELTNLDLLMQFMWLDNWDGLEVSGICLCLYLIVCRGVQTPTWKNTVPPKEPIPPPPKITPISKIYFKKFSR